MYNFIMADGKAREKMLNELLEKMMEGVNERYSKVFEQLISEEIQSYSNRELRELLGIEQ